MAEMFQEEDEARNEKETRRKKVQIQLVYLSDKVAPYLSVLFSHEQK